VSRGWSLGPYPASEPETQAVQNYMDTIFPDQRGPDLINPAPDGATGVYIDVHSYGRLVLWPWGFTSQPAPNGTQLQTLGRKFAYWDRYWPEQAIGLYPTDGTTDDYGYGELGVAAYTFENGTAFFQSCSYFENMLVPANIASMVYAAKVVRTPYMTPSGPDAHSLSLSDNWVPPGALVTLSGTVDDTRYNNSNGTEPRQNIASAECYVDVPPWNPGATAMAMSPADGGFDSMIEGVEATIDTTGLSEGKHILFVRGKDASNNWGAFSAIFLTVSLVQPPVWAALSPMVARAGSARLMSSPPPTPIPMAMKTSPGLSSSWIVCPPSPGAGWLRPITSQQIRCGS
jgi:carboxypeptidase T